MSQPIAQRWPVLKRLPGIALWAMEFGVILAGVLLTYVYWDDSLRADFLGSFLASSLALIVGVPIGIYINDLQRRASQTDARQAQAEADDLHRARILSLVVHELKFNKEMLLRRRRGAGDGRAVARASAVDEAGRKSLDDGSAGGMVLWSPLKVDLWRAVSDSGEIKYVHDADALDAVVRAYYRIGITMEFESRHRDAVLQSQFQDAQARGGAPLMAVKGLVDILVQGDAIAIRTIDEALTRLGDQPSRVPNLSSPASPST